MKQWSSQMSFNFNEITKTEKNKTLIVDALNLAFRWKHQGRTDFLEEYVQTVLSFAKSYKCSNIIITADQGSSSYRKSIFFLRINKIVKINMQNKHLKKLIALKNSLQSMKEL